MMGYDNSWGTYMNLSEQSQAVHDVVFVLQLRLTGEIGEIW